MNKGASFSTAGVVIQSYTSAGLGKSITKPTASGPFTCGTLGSGDVLSFDEVTFIAIQSGSFISGSTYLGGIAPTAATCTASSACGVYIIAGVTVNTAELNGALNMNIDHLTLANGAILLLGTPGSSAGFKFMFPIILDIFGTLTFAGAAGSGIFIPAGSALNLHDGGAFTSAVETFLQVFNPATGALIGTPVKLGTSISGPYFYTITSSGAIIIGTSMKEISNFYILYKIDFSSWRK